MSMLDRIAPIRWLVLIFATAVTSAQQDSEAIKPQLRSASKLRIHVSYTGIVNRPGNTYPANMVPSDDASPEFLPAASFPITLELWLDLASNRIRRDKSYSEWSFGNDAYVDRFDSTVLESGKVWQSKPPEKHPKTQYNHQYLVGDTSSIRAFSEPAELPLYAALGHTFVSLELTNLLDEDGVRFSRPNETPFAIEYTPSISGNFAAFSPSSQFTYDSQARVLTTRTYRGKEKNSECQISDYVEHAGVSIPSAWKFERSAGSIHLEDGTLELVSITSLDSQELDRIFTMNVEPGAIVLDAQGRELKRMTNSGELEPYPRSDRSRSGTWSNVAISLFWGLFACMLAGVGIFVFKFWRR